MAFDIGSFLGNNAGAIVGGLIGAAGNSGSSTNTQTATRDPWAAAQPYMLKNMENEAKLQAYYQQNPFNAQQQAGINNTFADADNFRSSVAPGLLDFANKGMTSSYSRQTGGAPGSGGGYGGAVKPGGLLSSGQGPFSVAPGNKFGQMDFAASNPYANGAIPAPKAAEPVAQQSYAGLLGSGSGGGGSNSGMSGGGSDMMGGTKQGGIGVGEYSDAITQKAMDTAQKFGMAGPVVGVLAALMSAGMDEYKALEMVNSYEDPIGALNALQGWTTADPTYSYSGSGGGGSSGNGVGGYGGEGYGSGTDGSSGGYGSSYGSGSVGGF